MGWFGKLVGGLIGGVPGAIAGDILQESKRNGSSVSSGPGIRKGLTKDQIALMKSLHSSTGLSFEEIKDAIAEAQGDENKLSTIIEKKAARE